MPHVFEEPQEQRTSTHIGAQQAETTAVNPTRGSASPTMLAIFAIPLLVIAGMLQYSKKFVDVFDETDNLEARVKEAKKQGFPFNASELAKKGAEKDNSYPALKSLFLNKDLPVKDAHSLEVSNYWEIEKPNFSPDFKDFLFRAKEVGKHKRFDAGYDYDQNFSLLLPEYSKLKLVQRALVYEAVHSAKHGQVEKAFASLDNARNICIQFADENLLIGAMVNVSCQSAYYRGLADVGIALRDNPEAQTRIQTLLNEDLPAPNIEQGLKSDFFAILAFLRNFEQAGGTEALIGVNSYSNYIPPAPENLVRGGLPRSAAAQGLLSKALKHYLTLAEIARTEPNPQIAGEKMDKYIASLDMQLSNLLSMVLAPVYSQSGASILRPRTSKAMAEWSLEIDQKYRGKYPESLPSRVDPGFGGTLNYRLIDAKHFIVYSSGQNKVDNGGPSGYRQVKKTTLGNNPTDDFGNVYPLIAKSKPGEPSSPEPIPLE